MAKISALPQIDAPVGDETVLVLSDGQAKRALLAGVASAALAAPLAAADGQLAAVITAANEQLDLAIAAANDQLDTKVAAANTAIDTATQQIDAKVLTASGHADAASGARQAAQDAAAGVVGSVAKIDRTERAVNRRANAAHGEDLLMKDTFNRADGGLGVSDSGHEWAALLGIATIANNAVVGNNALVVQDRGHSDVLGEAQFDAFVHLGTRVTMRGLGSNDYLYLQTSNTGIQLFSRIGGVDAPIGSAVTGSMALPLRLRWSARGNRVLAWLGNARDPILDRTLTSAVMAATGTGTQFGLFVNGAASPTAFALRRVPTALPIAEGAATRLAKLDRTFAPLVNPGKASVDSFLDREGTSAFNAGAPTGTLGAMDSGDAWIPREGTATVSGGRVTGSDGRYVGTAARRDRHARARFNPLTGNARLVVKEDLATGDYLYTIVSSPNISLNRIVGGVISNVGSFNPGAIPAAGELWAKMIGRTVQWGVGDAASPIVALDNDDYVRFGGAHPAGFRVRSTAAIESWFDEDAPRAVQPQLDNLANAARFQMQRDLRAMAHFATRHRDAVLTGSVETFGLTFDSPSDKPTQFRGALPHRTGLTIAITRNSGFFAVRLPSGVWVKRTLNMTEADMYALNLSGGAELPNGDHIYPPRDGDKFAIVNWVNNTIRWTDFGIDLSAIGVDKITGIAWAGGYLFAIPTRAAFWIVIDPYRVKKNGDYFAWPETFGLRLPTNAKPFAGGTMDAECFLVGAPFDNSSSIRSKCWRIDPFRMEGQYFDNGLDLGGNSLWCSPKTAPDARTWWAARDADSILRWDPSRNELKKLRYEHIPAVYARLNVLGGNKWTRLLFTPNLKLIATPGDENEALVIDTLLPDDHPDAAKLMFGGIIPTTPSKYIGGATIETETIFVGDQARHFFRVLSDQSEPLSRDLIMSSILCSSP